MVEQLLAREQIEAGEALLRMLDERGLQPDAALWLYSSELNSWKLMLAEAKVAKEGPKEIYRRIQGLLTELPEESRAQISLHDISLAKPDAPLIQLLRKAIRTGPGISGIRFTDNVVSGTLIEDVYIYRVA